MKDRHRIPGRDDTVVPTKYFCRLHVLCVTPNPNPRPPSIQVIPTSGTEVMDRTYFWLL